MQQTWCHCSVLRRLLIGGSYASVVGIDHLVLSVGDFARSKEFYRKLLRFLGFKLKYDYADMAGWSNGKTLFWIAAADAEGRKRKYRKGDIGFHHYAFELSSRKDVDELGAFLEKNDMTVIDPPGEYYERKLLCRVFRRSGRHETGRHDLGAAGEKAQAGCGTPRTSRRSRKSLTSCRLQDAMLTHRTARDARHHRVAAASLGGIERIVGGFDQIGCRLALFGHQ